MVSEERLRALEDRCARLERRIKRHRRMAAVSLVALAAGLLLGARRVPPPDIRAWTVRARQIIIEDDKGRTRASFHMSKIGPHLALKGRDGNGRVMLSVDSQDRPGLVLMGKNFEVKQLFGTHPMPGGYIPHSHPRPGGN